MQGYIKQEQRRDGIGVITKGVVVCSVIYLRTADIQVPANAVDFQFKPVWFKCLWMSLWFSKFQAVLAKDPFSAIRTSWQRIASLREVHTPSVATPGERRVTVQRNNSSFGSNKSSAFSHGSATYGSAFRVRSTSNLDDISPTVCTTPFFVFCQ